ncbi:hypothetical protein AAG906_003985 [Vitis piasezkii]
MGLAAGSSRWPSCVSHAFLLVAGLLILSTMPCLSQAVANLPSFRDGLDRLIPLFSSKGLSTRDMVALSGSHTIGQARCVTFRDRVYDNGTNIDTGFASTRRRRCPNLIQRKDLLQSDQVLFNGGSTDSIVTEYSKSPSTFSSEFASAMVKMGDIEPLLGSAGEIRKICNVIN